MHPVIGEEIRAIGGGYATVKEATLTLDGHEILYGIVVGRLDSSCCGEGGCGYANVIGYRLGEASSAQGGGSRVSWVETIDDAEIRERVARELRAREHVQEVRFWSPPQ